MRFDAGEIVLIAFPQTESPAPKKRPALVVLDIGDDDLVLAPITSRERSGVGDRAVVSWREAGLLRPSWVRLAKVACLQKLRVSRRLGKLGSQELGELRASWARLYTLT